MTDEEIRDIGESIESYMSESELGICIDDYVKFARAIEAKVRAEYQPKQCPRCEGPNGPLDVEDGYTITMDDCDMFVTKCGLCERVLRRSKNLFEED